MASGIRYDPAIWPTTRRVRHGDPGGCDVQRPGRSAAAYLHGMHRAAEERLGDPDHGHSELSVDPRAHAGSPVRVQVDVLVDDDQREPGDALQYRAQRRQFAPPELTRLQLALGSGRMRSGSAVSGAR